MALTKATYGMISADTSSIDLSIDANTLYVDSSANRVGIGTSSPSAPLDVAGIIRVAESGNTAFYGGNYVRVFNDQAYGFKNSGGTTKALISLTSNSYFNGGNVGIGTTVPSQKLVVNVDAAGIKPGLLLNNEHEYGSGVGVASTALQFGRDNSPSNGQTIISGQIYSGNEAETSSNPCFMGFSTKSGAAPYTLTERMRIDSSGNVGIGTTNPTANLVVTQSGNTPTSGFSSSQWQGCFVNTGTTTSIARVGIYSGNATTALLNFGDADDADIGGLSYDNSDNSLAIRTNNAERMRITSPGTVLVGKTAEGTNTDGIELNRQDVIVATRNGDSPLILNRRTSDGDIAVFRKDNSVVGSIGTNAGYLVIGSPVGTDAHLLIGNGLIHPATSTGGVKNAAIDIGGSSNRFKDLYLSGNAYVGASGFLSNNSGEFIKLDNVDDTIEFSTAGTERMRIDVSGGLFLNTTSAMDNCFVSLRDHSDGEAFVGIDAKNDSNVGIRLGHGGTRKWVWYSDPSDNLIWYSNANNAERMRIDSNGTMFLNNTGPAMHSAYKGIVFENGALINDLTRGAGKSITLAQNATVDTGNTFAYLATDEASWYQQFGGNHYFVTAPSGSAGADIAGTTRMFISNTGKVGIQESTPLAMLHIGAVSGVGNADIRLDNNTVNSSHFGLKWHDGTTQKAEITWGESDANLKIRNYRGDGSGSYGRIDFDVGSTSNPPTRMVIQGATGRVGIGTTDPVSDLEIYGSSPILTIRDGGTHGSNSTPYIELRDNTSGQAYIGVTDTSGVLAVWNLKGTHTRLGAGNVERFAVDGTYGHITLGQRDATSGADSASKGGKIAGMRSVNVLDWMERRERTDKQHGDTAGGSNLYGVTFGTNGAASRNKWYLGEGPSGSLEWLWQGISNGGTGATAGWNTNTFYVDNNYSYMVINFVKRVSSANTGTYYNGTGGVHDSSGNGLGNPYMTIASSGTLPQNVWCVDIQPLHAYHMTSNVAMGNQGLFRTDTGARLQQHSGQFSGVSAFRLGTSANQAHGTSHRSYLYYATDNDGTELHWACPMIYRVDGTQPKVSELLKTFAAAATV